jgi:predicted  nucleic acid-binding Zn-ribbon protein
VVPPKPEPVIAPPPPPKPVCSPEELEDLQRHYNQVAARIDQIRNVDMPSLQQQFDAQTRAADSNKIAFNGLEGQISGLLYERQSAVAAGEDGRGAVVVIDQQLSTLRSVSNAHKEQHNAAVRNAQDIDARMAALDNELTQRENELLTAQQQLAKCKVAA